MSPAEREAALDRAVGAVAALRRRRVGWTLAGGAAGLTGLTAAAAWVPFERLATPGSPLPAVLAACGVLVCVVTGLAAGRVLRRAGRASAEIERSTGLTPGDLRSAIELRAAGYGSPELAVLQRVRVASVLDSVPEGSWLREGDAGVRRLRRRITLGLLVPALLTAAAVDGRPRPPGAVLEVLSRPWAVSFPPPPPAMMVQPRGAEVVRGSFLTLRVTGAGRSRVTVAWSASDEPVRRVAADMVRGVAEVEIGPIEAPTLYWAEDDRGQASDTFPATPLDPLTLVDLELTLSYPAWMRRQEERLSSVPAVLAVPRGTEIAVVGKANYDLRGAKALLISPQGVDSLAMQADDRRVEGRFQPRRSGRVEWRLEPRGSVPAVVAPPSMEVSVVPDAGPLVRIRSPGRDVVAEVGDSVSLLIEASDDLGVSAVQLVAWREAAGGLRDAPVWARLDEGSASPLLVVQAILDAGSFEVLPGDAIAYLAVASDGNPANPAAASDTFFVRISTIAAERAETASRVEQLANRAAALDERAERLSRGARFAERRARSEVPVAGQGTGESRRADFGSTEHAREVLTEAQALHAAADSAVADLRAQRDRLVRGPTPDGSLLADLERLEQLYGEIVDSELGQRIADLESALRSLDRGALSDALTAMAREAAEIREKLSRAVQLLERAAVEQALKGARRKAADLADRQAAVAAREPLDSTWTGEQARLQGDARDLADEVADVEERVEREGADDTGQAVARAAVELERAVEHMAAAARAPSGDVPAAAGATEATRRAREAAGDLSRAERSLADAADRLRQDHREGALRAVDRATEEALQLAKEQADVLRSLRSEDSSTDVAGRQEALRQGLDNLSQSLAEAGRRTALLDRRTGAAAARAAEGMERVAENLGPGREDRSAATGGADEALRALGELASRLASSRRGIAEAASGTGLEEALERLADLGERQAGLNGEAGDLFLLLRGGDAQRDAVRRLAERQRELADELVDLSTRPGSDGLAGRPEELAAEADEIAGRLSSGNLDEALLARQERLFRRLLDAGRLLRRDDEDPDRRESTTARPRVSTVEVGASTDRLGQRFPYPPEEDMRGLSAAQRRWIYEYFDLLNERGPADGVSP